MSIHQLALRTLGVVVAIVLITSVFFSYRKLDEPKPLFRLDTPPQAAASPVDNETKKGKKVKIKSIEKRK